jgi:hypothetical protein
VKKKNIFKYVLFLCFIALCSSLHSQESDSLKNIIIINSDPAGAEVFLNNSLIGKTPLTLKNQSPGKLEILVKLDDKNICSEIVHYTGGEIEIYPLFNSEYAILNLITTPANAPIYLNDSLIGTTANGEFKIPLGINKIRVELADYAKFEKSFNFQKRKYNWYNQLIYKYGFIKVDDKGLGIKLKIDGQPFENSSTNFYKIPKGEIRFEAELNGEKTIVDYFAIRPNINYSINYKANYFTSSHIIESALLPGLGQFQDAAQLKGIGYFIATATFGALYLLENRNYKNNLEDYNIAKDNYEMANTEEEAINLGVAMEQSLNEVNDSIKKKNIFIGCMIGVYLLNIIDAYIFHTDGFDMDIIEIKNDNLGFNLPQIEINYPLN